MLCTLENEEIHTVEAAKRGEASCTVQMIHRASSRYAAWGSQCEEESGFVCLPAQTKSIKAVCRTTFSNQVSDQALSEMPAVRFLKYPHHPPQNTAQYWPEV